MKKVKGQGKKKETPGTPDPPEEEDLAPLQNRIPFLLDLALGEAPKEVKSRFRNAFTLFTQVLRRQRQLSSIPFHCACDMDGDEEMGEEFQQDVHVLDLEDISSAHGLPREELDPDRMVWVEGDVQRRFLIRPGQWLTLSKMDHDGSGGARLEFTCQVLPVPLNPKSTSTSKGKGSSSESAGVLRMNPVTEYNLKRALNIPSFLPIPPLQIRPLLSDPVINPGNRVLSYSPIHGRSLKLTRLPSPQQPISLKECDILIKDLFALNCKYLCLGDIVSVPLFEGKGARRLELMVSELNGKGQGDESCREVFEVSQDSSLVSLSSSEMSNYFRTKIGDSQIDTEAAPCLRASYLKLRGWMTQALRSLYEDKLNADLWPSFLIYGPVGSGKHSLCQAVASCLGVNFYFMNAANLIGDSSAFAEAKLRAVYDKIKNSFCPCLVFIKNLQLIGKDKDGHEDKRVVMAFKEFLQDISTLSAVSPTGNNVMSSRATFIVGSTDSPEALVPSVSQSFLFKLQLPSTVKSVEEVEKTLLWLFELRNAEFEDGLDLGVWMNRNWEGKQGTYGDLKALAAIAVRNSFTRRSNCSVEQSETAECKLAISAEDLDTGLKSINAAIKKATSSVEVPNVSWEDIGGLDDIKKELISSVKLPLEFPHLFATGIKRSGILLYGPPGTGKTLIAKAVATEFKLSFLSVKGPELLNMYVGQSEQNVRDVFEKARNAVPCIIFFDELDALAPNRGRAGDSGGVMDRVVSQILAELDGTHSTPDVFVIGATNRPDLIDPALLRPGRFDKLLYVGINYNVDSKTSVLKALTRKFQLGDTVDLTKVAEMLPQGMSGADLYSLCSDAYMTAVERQISQFIPIPTSSLYEQGMESQQPETDSKSTVIVNQCDFEAAIARTSPTLSEGAQARYEALKTMKR